MNLAFDTSVLVDLMRGDDWVRAAYVQAKRAEAVLSVSVLVLQELRFGAHMSARPAVQHAVTNEWLRGAAVTPYEVADAEGAAALQAQMERAGLRAPRSDFLIGAHALARGCTLVTANTRHFENIPGLELLNWRLPPEAQDHAPHA